MQSCSNDLKFCGRAAAHSTRISAASGGIEQSKSHAYQGQHIESASAQQWLGLALVAAAVGVLDSEGQRQCIGQQCCSVDIAVNNGFVPPPKQAHCQRSAAGTLQQQQGVGSGTAMAFQQG
jgi:hypothetical protein